MKADSMPERLLIGPGSPPSLDPVYPELSPPLEPCPNSGSGGWQRPGAVPAPGRPGGSQGPGACLSRRLKRLEGGCRDQGGARSTLAAAPAKEPLRDKRRGSCPGRDHHHGHPTKYRSQRRSSTDAAPPLILTSTSDVTAVVSGLISTVAIPAARANSTGAAMYSKRLLVPTLKITSNPTPNSNHIRSSFSSGTCSPKRTTVGRRTPWQRGQSGGRARSA